MSVLKLTLISDPSKFRTGLNAASKDLQKFQRTANQVSRGINKALGAAGLGIGIAKLTGFLKESTRAASEDAKSKSQLALALQNTLGATDETIAKNEQWIASISLATAQFDDNLRPALAQTVRATGDLTKGQGLLKLALDVSAGTGKDLGAVTAALSKAYAGNQTALKKLVPGVQLGTEWVKNLGTAFRGAAENAAANDPYQRFAVLMDQIRETVGAELLPVLEQFAQYLQSSEGKQNLKQILDIFIFIAQTVGGIIKLVIENIAVVKALVAAVLFAKTAWAVVTGAVKLYDLAVKIATISTKALKVALITTGIGALVVAVGLLASAWLDADAAKNQYLEEVPSSDWIEGGVSGPGLGINGETWLTDGYSSYEEWKLAMDQKKQNVIDARKAAADELVKTGKKFRDAVGLAFGVKGKDEYSIFNVDVVIDKLKRMVDAARGFKGNLEKLKNQGAGLDVINEIIAMGPAQGNIVAKSLLTSGRLSEYLGLRGSLYNTGTNAQGVANTTAEKVYKIEVKEQSMTAQAIVDAIRAYEKKTKRKYFVTNG